MAAKRTNPQIKSKLMEHVEALYNKYGGKFFDALEDAESKKLQMNFTATIDLADAAPVVTTEISFKDKCKEAGMDVTKTFSADTTDVLDDPTQPELIKTPRKKKGDADAPTEGEAS